MLTWIIAAIALYYCGLFIPSILKLTQMGMVWGAGPQDVRPERTIMLGRAERAHENIKENLPAFLAVATLTLVLGVAPAALTGAAVWVIARAIYLPLYILGVPVLRTLVFGISLIGLIMMILALTAAPIPA